MGFPACAALSQKLQANINSVGKMKAHIFTLKLLQSLNYNLGSQVASGSEWAEILLGSFLCSMPSFFQENVINNPR